jgi:hypothetical protein
MNDLFAKAMLVALRMLGRVRRAGTDNDRGDVPGWVLVTLMTATMVTALWAIAQDQLIIMLNDAFKTVTGP